MANVSFTGLSTQQPPRQTGGRLPGLEALRCVAAFCVLLLHTRAVFGGEFVFGRGYLGVDFFLMLSGYLMTRVQEPRLASGRAPWAFMIKRYRRLWPVMAAGGIIGIPMLYLQAQGFGAFIWIAAANMALLPVWGQTFIFPLNIPAWTIFVQLVCEGVQVLGLRRVPTAILPLVVAVLAAAMGYLGETYGSFDLGAKPDTLLPGFIRCLMAYSIGMVLARWWGNTAPLPVPPLLALVAMPLAIIGGWVWHAQGWWFDFLFVMLVCPVMLAGGLRLRRFQRAAGLLGQLSFPLFALQMPVLQGMHALGFTYWAGLFGAVVVGCAGAAIAAWLQSAARPARAVM